MRRWQSFRDARCKSLYDEVTLSFPQATLVTLCALTARERRLKNYLGEYLVQNWKDQRECYELGETVMVSRNSSFVFKEFIRRLFIAEHKFKYLR